MMYVGQPISGCCTYFVTSATGDFIPLRLIFREPSSTFRVITPFIILPRQAGNIEPIMIVRPTHQPSGRAKSLPYGFPGENKRGKGIRAREREARKGAFPKPTSSFFSGKGAGKEKATRYTSKHSYSGVATMSSNSKGGNSTTNTQTLTLAHMQYILGIH